VRDAEGRVGGDLVACAPPRRHHRNVCSVIAYRQCQRELGRIRVDLSRRDVPDQKRKMLGVEQLGAQHVRPRAGDVLRTRYRRKVVPGGLP
jgi:hypothetical protein